MRQRRRPPLKRRIFRWFGTAIFATAVLVGSVSRRATCDGPTLALALVPLLAVVWVASGMIARRLSRPAFELARVAGELGSGNLSARTALRRCGPAIDDEFVVMHRAFDEMAERLEAQLRAQKELLAAVSHELRTPLARMRLLVEMGRDGVPRPTTFDELEREVIEIDALVGDLLANSRLDFHVLQRAPLDASDVARMSLIRAGISPALLRTTGPLPLAGDEGLLLRALANLLRNAQEHGGGLDVFIVEAKDGVVRLMAEDRGPGLPVGDASALFEPFAQKSEGATKGTLGLGLALVKRIAEAHGGRVFAEPALPRGARVGFELPMA